LATDNKGQGCGGPARKPVVGRKRGRIPYGCATIRQRPHGRLLRERAFVDAGGLPLDGGSFAYTIEFVKDQLPQHQRFWSLTAYTPDAIELVPNSLDKYVVASYTPGLVTADDGSVTIYVQADPPKRWSSANWLPVLKGSFSLLFRVYGPEGSALDGTCVPPKIHRTSPR
jgi:hypothetical protein